MISSTLQGWSQQYKPFALRQRAIGKINDIALIIGLELKCERSASYFETGSIGSRQRGSFR